MRDRTGAKSILIIFLLLTSVVSGAQDLKPVFDKAVDYIHCKAIQVVRDDVQKGQKFESTCNCDCENSPDMWKVASVIPVSETATLALSREIMTIKEKYNPTNKEEAVKILTEDIFDRDEMPKFALFINKRKDRFPDLRQEIAQKTREILESVTAVSVEQGTDSQVAISNTLSHVDAFPVKEELFINQSAFQLITSIVLLLLIVAIIVLANKLVRIQDAISKAGTYDAFTERNSSLRGAEFADLLGQVGTLRTEVKRNAAMFSALDSDIKDLKTVYRNKTSTGPTQMSTSVSKVQDPESTFYLSSPNPDGSFDEESAHTTYKEGQSIYKFTKSANLTARFVIENRDTSVNLALQYPDKVIDPVCEPLNAYSSRSRNIRTDVPGEAHLLNGKWQLSRKAKIYYEH